MGLLQGILICLAFIVAFAILYESYKRKRRLSDAYHYEEETPEEDTSISFDNTRIEERTDHSEAPEVSELGILEKSRPVVDDADPYSDLIPDVDMSSTIKLADNHESILPQESLMEETQAGEETEFPEHVKKQPEVISLYLLAEASYPFTGYDLYQALTMSGLTFGQMNIFHLMDDDTILFSVASAKEPGSFDLDDTGAWRCDGLCFFLQLDMVDNPLLAFDKMLNVIKELADELGGQLANKEGGVLTSDMIAGYRHLIRDFQQQHRMETHYDASTE